MIHFLNPIWLAAGAGILIPVLIHLWNIKQGRVLRIGSTRLMAEATRKQSSRLRLSQLLLLVVRCLLIICIAMLMAGPEWREAVKQSKKGWVLIDERNFHSVYSQFKTNIDSLLAAGLELHLAKEDFPVSTLADSTRYLTNITGKNGSSNASEINTVNNSANSARSTTPDSLQHASYWRLLQKLDKQLPAGYPVYFFTGNKMADVTGGFHEPRPVVSIDLRWKMANLSTDTSLIQVAKRQLANGKYLSTSFVSTTGGNYFLSTDDQKGVATSPRADTSTLVIKIYNKHFDEDARYLEAAIRAIASFRNYKVDLQTVNSSLKIARPDWLFWLSNEIPPANIVAQNIIIYQPGKAVKSTSWISSAAQQAGISSIDVYQRVMPDSVVHGNMSEDASGTAITTAITNTWTDGFGNPLLTKEVVHKPKTTGVPDDETHNTVYRFYTRFHPGWNDLPWNGAFPRLLFPLIIKSPIEKNDIEKILAGHDNRSTEPALSMPTVMRETYKQNKSVFKIVDFEKVFWLIAFLLFATERILATAKASSSLQKPQPA